MSSTICITLLDFDRYGALVAAHRAGAAAELSALLATGAGWRDPNAAEGLHRCDERGIRFPHLYYRFALDAQPERFAEEIAEWLSASSPEDPRSMLIHASATDEVLDLGVSLEELMGLFSAEWRSDYWEQGKPEPFAPPAVRLALGGLTHGARVMAPEEVKKAAAALDAVSPNDHPPASAGPWPTTIDPDGDFDEILRERLRDLNDGYTRARDAGSATYVSM